MVARPQPNQRYTYADYLLWPDNERWELIDGIAYNMTPAPSTEHQRVLLRLTRKFADYFEDHSCEVFIAPFDVRLFPDQKKQDEHVVQPDLTVVCDSNKITATGCEGVPDFALGVLSPWTAKKDRGLKKQLYERAVIKEYWIVDPLNQTIETFLLSEQGTYEAGPCYGKGDVIDVPLFEGLVINLTAVFT
ncbi:hypothetical protein BEP19_09390 [Ammoniphilus oxalaticus]|uniref:Putative restriction endonuclease domain-containing protein n=1 Tax=Ammoniphilus oxalaticus TaxID=66863 RepID=A0A419SKV5_9BACL|nr:Uma2 family endonuclease [Ammoniphilus oxalaticus]RKD24580.1 hypothetical protein BEP19_09390 [Ammoniphilus oxalaticus]